MAKSTPPRATASPRKKSMPPAPPVVAAPPEPAHNSEPTQQVAPTHEQIAERAYGLWLSRGGHDGDEFGDWLRAESELRRQN